MENKLKDTFDIAEIAVLLGIPNPDEFEWNGEAYHYVYGESIKEGLSETNAESEAEKAEQSEQDDAYCQIYDAIESVAETFFGYHKLNVTKITTGKNRGMYKVTPQLGWLYAATCIRMTINGVGYFEFNSTREFLDSGPYTPRTAVLSHLHWVKRYSEVYGERSPKDQYHRRLR